MLNYRTWKELEKLSAFTELFFFDVEIYLKIVLSHIDERG